MGDAGMSQERTPEDWGRVAVSLPGWRWMPGMLSRCNTDTRRAVYRWLAGLDTRHYGLVCIVQDKHGRPCRVDTTLKPDPNDLPDPDDHATAGCLLALLWPECFRVTTGIEDDEMWAWWDGEWHDAPTLGRACIAAAEALGRWPGGAS